MAIAFWWKYGESMETVLITHHSALSTDFCYPPRHTRMTWWIWIVIGFALLALEFTAASLHVGFFAVGGFVVGLLLLFGVEMPLWGQLIIFTATSLLAFFFIRPAVMRRLKLDQNKVVDSLVGEQAIAMEDLPTQGLGKAEMRGTTWSARNVGETGLSRGQRCVVVHVEGLVIHVRAS
jgi:inner membrane protein